MKNNTYVFQRIYEPVKALVVYACEHDIYVESFDIDESGHPINPHPLSVSETAGLTEMLYSSSEFKGDFFKPRGLLPHNVLHINPTANGFVTWYTRAQQVTLLFTKNLNIPSGPAHIPSLIWKASRKQLYIYAINTNTPRLNTKVYRAPFHNVSDSGSVCMGTVDINIPPGARLEEFIEQWQQYFFRSEFSHLLGSFHPVEGDLDELWATVIQSGGAFPVKRLIPAQQTIQQIISHG